jgi:hypothetical protein
MKKILLVLSLLIVYCLSGCLFAPNKEMEVVELNKDNIFEYMDFYIEKEYDYEDFGEYDADGILKFSVDIYEFEYAEVDDFILRFNGIVSDYEEGIRNSTYEFGYEDWFYINCEVVIICENESESINLLQQFHAGNYSFLIEHVEGKLIKTTYN